MLVESPDYLELLEGGRLALGCMMYDSKKRKPRRKAITSVLDDYEISMNIGCFVCFGQKSRRECERYEKI